MTESTCTILVGSARVDTTVVVNVSFNEDYEVVKDFIQDEQIPFIFGFGMEKLKRFEWFLNEEKTAGTLIEVFDDSAAFAELGGKVIGTPINLKFRELITIESLTVLGSISDEFREKLKPMGAKVRTYLGGFSLQ